MQKEVNTDSLAPAIRLLHRRWSVPVLVGIMPLQSSKHAEFIHNELAGVTVPDDVRERMRDAGENGKAEGIAQARELLEACRPMVSGTYLVPSFGRVEVVGELVTLAKGL